MTVSRTKLGLLAAIGLLLVVGAVRTTSSAAGASAALEPADCRIPPCGQLVPLGKKHWFNGPVRIGAYSTGAGPYLEVLRPKQGDVLSSAVGDGPPDNGEAIVMIAAQVGARPPGQPVYSTMNGRVRGDVRSVELRYRRGTDSKLRRVDALTAPARGEDLRRIGAVRPFGVFDAVIGGCVPVEQMRAIAFDADGRRLGVAGTPEVPGEGPPSCDAPPPPFPSG